MTIVFFMLGIVFLLVIVFFCLTIQIQLDNIHLQKQEKEKMILDYTIKVRFLFFGKVPIGKITITKQKIEKLHLEQKLQQINWTQMEQELIKKEEIKEILQKLQLDLVTFHLKIDLGVEDVILTSMLTTLLASGLGWLLAKAIKQYQQEKYDYVVMPIYQNKNVINLQLHCIIQVKMVHIIGIINVLLKRRERGKNERTSNRRSYGYSYE